MAGEPAVTAAGGIVWRRSEGGQGVEILVIHRQRYQDWSLPKGKPEQGETLWTTAVREIEEETGVRVRLGPPLPSTRYRVASGRKVVAYWTARPVQVTEFEPNREVDEIRWVSPRTARRLLTYAHDRALVETFGASVDAGDHRARTLVVARHAKALDRSSWPGDDLDRPLAAVGEQQAEALAAVLDAYGVRHVVTSPAVRCWQTVEPYARRAERTATTDPRLWEDTDAAAVRAAVAECLEHKRPTVLCGHRPTLPWVFEALGLPAVKLAPAEAVVVHHRRGRVLSVERIDRPGPVRPGRESDHA